MSSKKGRFLFWGVILGFIGGLFLAPKKGSELRKDTKDKLDEVKENPKEVLRETYVEIKDKLSNLVDDTCYDENIDISEDEIIISKTFDDEGENK